MKKFFVLAMALFFVTATSGLVMAEGTAAVPAKTVKSHKGKHHKKAPKAAASTAPASTPGAK